MFDPTQSRRYGSPLMYRPEMDRIVLHGPGSEGPVEGMSVAVSSASQVPAPLPMPRLLKGIPRDKPLSPFWWIDPAREWGIRNGVDVADTRPMLQSALDAGEDLDLGSGGRFWLSDKLTYKRQCQQILGSRPFSFEFQYRYGASLCVASGRDPLLVGVGLHRPALPRVPVDPVHRGRDRQQHGHGIDHAAPGPASPRGTRWRSLARWP
jgi:hypothetical protein